MNIKTVYVFLVIFGLGVIILGIGVGFKDVNFLFSSSNANGKIVSLNSHQEYLRSRRKYTTTEYAVVSYRTADGSVIEFRDNVSILKSLFSEEQNVEVIYNRNNPEEAHIKTYYPFLVLPGILVAFGMFWLLCLIPSYIFVKSRINQTE